MSGIDLYFARHGDTFAPGTPVVWAGARNDLPLAPRGIEQAHALGRALRHRGVSPLKVVTGPLERTREFARLALLSLGSPVVPTVDPRLDELDYGDWSGLTNGEVIERFGRSELERWNTLSIWPKNAGWGSHEAEVIREVHELVREIVASGEGPVLLVSSNGRLRYVLTLVERELDRRVANQTFKIKTGHLAQLHWNGERFSLPLWDVSAEDFGGTAP